MSDGFTAIPPPAGGMDQSSAIQEAMARAKQIAAKLHQGGPAAVAAAIAAQDANTAQDTEASEYRKRALEEAGIGNNGEPNLKKSNVEAVPLNPNDPKTIAMQAAANIAQKAGLGSMAVEEIRVPNKFVGLIIGRGGEMINKLQSESGARIQVAPDPPPGQLMSERNITITGTPQAVSNAKVLIGKICDEGKVPDHLAAAQQPGEFGTELMIPASKVGLIIGKGGETIRSLQERAGCRMIMVQDGAYTNAPEKPLRISGDPQKCQHGRSLVMDLLTEKELEQAKGGDFNNKVSDYGTPVGQGGQTVEVNVPRDIVGFVIGKGGDTIKKIQAESGCRVQFKMPDPGNTPHRICVLQGDQQQLQKAQGLIDEIVTNVSSRPGRGGGGGRDDRPPRNQPPSGPGIKSVDCQVLSNKCGLVIGKGGETVRNICQITGAYVEINRSIPENALMKSFTIKGTESQIMQAQDMIREKVGDQNIVQQNVHGQQGGQGGQMGGQQQQQQGGQWGYQYGNQQQQQQQQYQQPQQQQQYGQQYGQYQQGGGGQQQAAAGQQSQAQSGQAAGGAAAGAQPDYTAAWQAYYQQYYQQYGMQPQAATAAASGATAATSTTGATQAPAGQAAAAGQPDYSAYYYQQFYPGYQQQQGQQQPQGQQGGGPPGQHSSSSS